jgi:hypothetical protein
MSILLKTLLLTLFLYSFVKTDETEPRGLGLLHETGDIVISKSSEHLRVGVLLTANFSLPDIHQQIESIIIEIKKIKEIPGVKSSPSNKAAVEKLNTAMANRLQTVKKIIKNLHTFKNDGSTKEELQYKCELQFPAIDSNTFDKLKEEISALVGHLDLTLADTKVTQDELRKITDTCYSILTAISATQNSLENRRDIINALTNNEVPESLHRLFETQPCMPTGNLETIHINFCNLNRYGLHCECDISVYKTTEKYTKNTAVSYDGVQLVAETTSQVFVTNDLRRLGLLDCGDIPILPYNPDDSPLNTDLYCTYTPYDNDCSKAISEDNFVNILYYCNFTRTEPELVTRTNTGLLIMNDHKNIIIKEYGVDKSVKSLLPSRTPVLITSSLRIGVTTGGLDLTFEPVTTTVERKVLYTYLTKDFIKSMQKAATYHDWKANIEDHHIMFLVALILIALVTVVVIIQMCLNPTCHFKTIKRTHKLIRQAGDAKSNFKQNKNYLKNIIKNQT